LNVTRLRHEPISWATQRHAVPVEERETPQQQEACISV